MIDCSYNGELVVGERIRTFGIDWGPRGLILLYKRHDYGLVKIPGHNFWAGIAMNQDYAPTEYAIVKFVARDFFDDGRLYSIPRLEGVPKSSREPGRRWHAVAEEMKAEVRKLGGPK